MELPFTVVTAIGTPHLCVVLETGRSPVPGSQAGLEASRGRRQSQATHLNPDARAGTVEHVCLLTRFMPDPKKASVWLLPVSTAPSPSVAF